MRCSKPGWSCVITSMSVLCAEHVVVDFHLRLHLHLRRRAFFSDRIRSRSMRSRSAFPVQHIVNARLESLPLRQIQLQRPKAVRKKNVSTTIPP